MPKPLPDDTWRNLFYPPPDYQYFQNANKFPFEPAAAGFSWRNAWWLAEISMLAYVKDFAGTVQPNLKSAGFDLTQELGLKPQISTKGWMAAASKPIPFAVVAFRGTDRDDSRTVLTDAHLEPKVSDSGSYILHQGFSDAFEQVWKPEIEPWLNSFLKDHPGAPVYLTGHSLGAALAVIAMGRFTQPNSAQYTFGCPRVGDDRFTNIFLKKGPVFRFVNSVDIVTQIPLELKTQAYFRHVGMEKYIDRHGGIHDSFSLPQRLDDVLPGILEHIGDMGVAAWGLLQELRNPDKLRDYRWKLFPTSLSSVPPGSPPFLVGNHSPARYPTRIWNYYSGQ